MAHIYNGILLSQKKRNEIELFVVRWTDLESVIQSEVSQKEKNKSSMLTHIYGTKKNIYIYMALKNVEAGQEQRRRRREWT